MGEMTLKWGEERESERRNESLSGAGLDSLVPIDAPPGDSYIPMIEAHNFVIFFEGSPWRK
jgi:hypothetical protein